MLLYYTYVDQKKKKKKDIAYFYTTEYSLCKVDVVTRSYV